MGGHQEAAQEGRAGQHTGQHRVEPSLASARHRPARAELLTGRHGEAAELGWAVMLQGVPEPWPAAGQRLRIFVKLSVKSS